MFKRLAARGKQPPGPVSPTTNTQDHFDLEQNNEGECQSPVSPSSVFTVTVYTLDDDQPSLEVSVQRDSDGQWLFDEACEQLGGIQEKDYFGLRFIDHDKQRQWVDLTRNIYRQLKHMNPCCVSFRVKHYPPSPMEDFKQEITKYLLYLQLKRDILHSRLLCQGNDAYELAAYIAQIDLGDYDDMEDQETYLSDYKILPNQSPKSETKIVEIHKTLKGLVPSEAEAKFLEAASKMETYGIDPYSVKDQKGNVLYLGLTHVGVVTFQGSRRAHIFKWSDITKFNYDGKLFIIHVTFREDNQFKRKAHYQKKHILGFKCETRAAALSLWRWAVDRYCFFTLKRSSEAKRSKSGGGLFRRSHTFRFSGRCQREALSNSLSLLTLPQPEFSRASSFRREERLASSVPPDSDKFATFPRTRRQDDADQALTAAASVESTSGVGYGEDLGDRAESVSPLDPQTESSADVEVAWKVEGKAKGKEVCTVIEKDDTENGHMQIVLVHAMVNSSEDKDGDLKEKGDGNEDPHPGKETVERSTLDGKTPDVKENGTATFVGENGGEDKGRVKEELPTAERRDKTIERTDSGFPMTNGHGHLVLGEKEIEKDETEEVDSGLGRGDVDSPETIGSPVAADDDVELMEGRHWLPHTDQAQSQDNIGNEAGGDVPDGGVVETLVVPAASSRVAAAPPSGDTGTSERGVDVGDGHDLYVPDDSGAHKDDDRHEADGGYSHTNNLRFEGDAAESPKASNHLSGDQPEPHGPPAKAGRSRLWRVCLSSLVLGVVFSIGALVLLFELGPKSPAGRSFAESGPGAVLEDWRQQWYLPLRHKFLPSKP